MPGISRLNLPIPLPPMEAKLVEAVPVQPGWQYEPKWDGFRCIALRSGDEMVLQSKAGRPLQRYFPEVEAMVRALPERQFAVDGELVIPIDGCLSFDALQMRLHPAESRVRKLAGETPARLILFDCLAMGDRTLIDAPLSTRRAALEAFQARCQAGGPLLSPCSTDPESAANWLAGAGGDLDGVIAKRLDEPYRPGERAMLKVKKLRSADCVVGGFRYAAKEKTVGSLLLGLHDEAGRLNHVGFTSAIPATEKAALTSRLEALVSPPGFTGNAPGGPSRWSRERSAEWWPLRAELVVEVRYDHVTADRFRHGTKFLRWRPDKDPGQCLMEQLRPETVPPALLAGMQIS